MMLGRKQSLKGEPVLADYGPDEAFNESADTEWVNKVFLRVFMMIFFLVTLISLFTRICKTSEDKKFLLSVFCINIDKNIKQNRGNC
jgi:hypothetical protein